MGDRWRAAQKPGHVAFRCPRCSGVVSLPLEDPPVPDPIGGPTMTEWMRRWREFEALKQDHVCPQGEQERETP